MRVDLLEETLDRLEREGRRPKFIYTVPTFQNPAGVTMSLSRRRRLVEIAHERELLVLEDNPYGLLRYEGDALPPLYALDGGVYVMYLGTFSKILSPGIRLGWVAAPPPVLEKINLGKQGADLCTSTLSQLMVQAYFERGHWRDYVDSLTDVYRTRRDTMLDALAEHFPPQAEWTRPGGGLFIWATLPDFIDTTDLLARALRDNVAFVPGEAAFLDGRGRSSMRLNFSGVGRGVDPRGHPPHRRGRDRAGRAVRHAHRRARPRPPSRAARWCGCRHRPSGRGGPKRVHRRAALERVAVLKGGRSLERQVSLRSGARVEDALARLGHEVVAIDVGPGPDRRLREARPDVAFIAMHGRDGEDGTVQELLEILDIPYTGSGVLACVRSMDKVLAKHLMLEAGIPTPDFFAFNETAFRELGAAEALGAIEERLDFPIVVKPSSQGSALGIKFARSPRTCRRRWSRRSPTTRRCCSSATWTGATWPSRSSTASRCRSSRPCRRATSSTTSRPATRSAARAFVCPAELPAGVTEQAQELALRTYRLLGCYAFARVDLMLDAGGDAHGAGGQPDPRPDRDQPAAPGRRGGRDHLRRAGRTDPGAGARAGRRRTWTGRARAAEPHAGPEARAPSCHSSAPRPRRSPRA